jgi:hypothetical protein
VGARVCAESLAAPNRSSSTCMGSSRGRRRAIGSTATGMSRSDPNPLEQGAPRRKWKKDHGLRHAGRNGYGGLRVTRRASFVLYRSPGSRSSSRLPSHQHLLLQSTPEEH